MLHHFFTLFLFWAFSGPAVHFFRWFELWGHNNTVPQQYFLFHSLCPFHCAGCLICCSFFLRSGFLTQLLQCELYFLYVCNSYLQTRYFMCEVSADFPKVLCFITHFPKEHCFTYTGLCPFTTLLLGLIFLQFFATGFWTTALIDLVSLADFVISFVFAVLFKEMLVCILLQTW